MPLQAQRRVFVIGRNMSDIVHMALEMGYLKAPDDVLARMDELKNTPHERNRSITTGARENRTSALVRIANKDTMQVHIIPEIQSLYQPLGPW